MTNALKGEVTVIAAPPEEGGAAETLTLIYDWDAWAELEELLDKSMLEILADMNRNKKAPPRLKLVHGLFWAGLRAKHPDITVDDAKALIARCGGAYEVFEKIGEGFGRAFPKAEAKGETDAEGPQEPAETPAEDGTSNTASGSGSSTD